jgi:DNA primase
MIDPATIERIYDAADIVDVVKDFVNLKKRGANYLGLCPFHNEKTPSFSVSSTKGIFKCFGCGKGGNAVNFIMEQEHLTYIESLRYLARKFHIEIEERELTPEEQQQQNDRESLMVVSAFAQRYFSDTLIHHPEGKAVGLSYFYERGFRDDIIKKFELGYCPDQRDSFTQAALKAGYKKEFLEKTGLTIIKENAFYDRFFGRVLFPIHSLSGKVIGFGGRTLRTDKNVAKYLNSPESEIYHKSRILYGIFQARKAIEQADKCFLVEGYTDVLSMHQAGIENVVASSGTSLTSDQIRLIKRFAPNVTILYDGDDAGIKASLRGIDLILEEGLNVKVVLLPDKEDPDSFSKKVNSAEFQKFIKENERDFISFKTLLLLDEAKNDPVKKANLISEVVRSVAVIPDPITRSVYLRECSSLLKADERILYSQVNKIRREKANQKFMPSSSIPEERRANSIPVTGLIPTDEIETHEREIARLLIMYGNLELVEEKDAETGESHIITVAQYIIQDLVHDELQLIHPVYKQIFEECQYLLLHEIPISEKYFIQHPDETINKVAADILSSQRPLSKIYARNEIYVETEDLKLKKILPDTLITFKSKKIKLAISEARELLIKAEEEKLEEEKEDILRELDHLNSIRLNLSKSLGNRIII